LSQVVSGLEFFVFSLVDVAERKAYPLAVKQTVRSEAEKEAIKERKKKWTKKSKATKSKPKGRKKGGLNKDKNELNLSAELMRINELLSSLVKLVRVFIRCLSPEKQSDVLIDVGSQAMKECIPDKSIYELMPEAAGVEPEKVEYINDLSIRTKVT
jgi:hypothetical protein